MAIDIKVPSVGESITEGRLVRWLKKDGAHVKEGEPVFELETEKASTEVPAPAEGKLHIVTPEGETVAIGASVGAIDPTADGAAAARPASPPVRKAEKAPKAAPAAARQAAEAKVGPAESVAPSEDTGGRSAGELAPAPVRREAGAETRERMSPIRARIAERLLASQKGTASLTTFNEIDMTAVMELRGRLKDAFKEKHHVGLGFMSFFVKASALALKAFPLVGARIDGSDIVHAQAQNIGVAVSTEKGLMVPVLHDIEQMSFADVEKAIADLAERARTGKIQVADLQGGTFTITNGGVFGSMLSTPILNPPQSAILGLHAIQKRAVVRNDAIVARPMMYVALTYDHRLIDGREAVLFLVRIKELVEEPVRLLLEI